MTARPDMSDKLIHFTSGATRDEAFERFRTIISEARLLGGFGMIRGSHTCVCLSEAPLPLHHGLVNPDYYSKYQPFGVLFEKQWIYEQGGRPVIYGPTSDYDILPEDLKWRHVRYEPPSVDFSWEREWRIPCWELPFDPGVATLILPSEDYLPALVSDHDENQEAIWHEYSTILGGDELAQYGEDFPWRIAYLGGERG